MSHSLHRWWSTWLAMDLTTVTLSSAPSATPTTGWHSEMSSNTSVSAAPTAFTSTQPARESLPSFLLSQSGPGTPPQLRYFPSKEQRLLHNKYIDDVHHLRVEKMSID